VGFDDLHVVVIEQIAGGVIDLGHGQLEIDLGLNEIQLGLGQLGLGVQNEEHRLGAQLVLAFVGTKGIAGKVGGDFCGSLPLPMQHFETVFPAPANRP
jgi:hypothetical protein